MIYIGIIIREKICINLITLLLDNLKSSKYSRVKQDVHKNEHIKGKYNFIKDNNKEIHSIIPPNILHCKGELIYPCGLTIVILLNKLNKQIYIIVLEIK